jgi:hypothetical protein
MFHVFLGTPINDLLLRYRCIEVVGYSFDGVGTIFT